MSEDDHVALSGLQHLVFCERQAALIHVERLWRDDAATVAGTILHERVDERGVDHRAGVRVARSVSLASDQLGVYGRADVVEYRKQPDGSWHPYPVEFKRGRAGRRLADAVQLCAQAICLEEMHGVAISEGAIYYGESHRRVVVQLDTPLRQTTQAAATRLRGLVARGEVPRVARAARCSRCSLEPICLPGVTGAPDVAANYLARLAAAEEPS